jgi:hypothetical protein
MEAVAAAMATTMMEAATTPAMQVKIRGGIVSTNPDLHTC